MCVCEESNQYHWFFPRSDYKIIVHIRRDSTSVIQLFIGASCRVISPKSTVSSKEKTLSLLRLSINVSNPHLIESFVAISIDWTKVSCKTWVLSSFFTTSRVSPNIEIEEKKCLPISAEEAVWRINLNQVPRIKYLQIKDVSI